MAQMVSATKTSDTEYKSTNHIFEFGLIETRPNVQTLIPTKYDSQPHSLDWEFTDGKINQMHCETL